MKQKRSKVSRGLLLGRFQPFHNGHLALAMQALGECDEVVIVIGSAQFNYIEKDPFTSGERLIMIHDSLVQAGIDLKRCYIVPVANDENNARWLANLKSMVPPFDYIYSGNDLVRHLALSYGSSLKMRAPKFVQKQEFNGSYIRSLISSNDLWRKLVPPAVSKMIDDIDGVARVKMLSTADSNPQRW